MAEEVCDLWELPKAQCSHCTGGVLSEEGAYEKAPTLTTTTGTGGFRRYGIPEASKKVAEFHTGCPGCSDPIEPGDPIKKDASGDWVHEECA